MHKRNKQKQIIRICNKECNSERSYFKNTCIPSLFFYYCVRLRTLSG